MSIGEGDFRKLKEDTIHKEKEWRGLMEEQVKTLENMLMTNQEKLEQKSSQFEELKEDFKHNLVLLQERDAEMQILENSLQQYKDQIYEYSTSTAQLSSQVEGLQRSIANELEAKEDIKNFYKKKLDDAFLQNSESKRMLTESHESEISQLEEDKMRIKVEYVELSERMDVERHALISEHETETLEQKRQHRIEISALNQQLLERNIKIEILSKELSAISSAASTLVTEAERKDSLLHEYEEVLTKDETTNRQLLALRDAKIQDLMNELSEARKEFENKESQLNAKNEDLDKTARQREVALINLQKSAAETEKSLNNRSRELRFQLEALQQEHSRLKTKHLEEIRCKDAAYEQLSHKCETLKAELKLLQNDDLNARNNQNNEVQRCEEVINKYKFELQTKREDIARYKRELQIAIEAQRELEREKEQMVLDVERKFELQQSSTTLQSENLVKTLSQQVSDLTARQQDFKREIDHNQQMISCLKKERDLAEASLSSHGLKVIHDIPLKTINNNWTSSQIEQLQLQNSNLRNVISQLKDEMEAITHAAEEQKRLDKLPLPPDYVASLETEIRDLKNELDNVKHANINQALSEKDLENLSKNNPLLAEHLHQLNTSIKNLREDKIKLTIANQNLNSQLEHTRSLISKGNQTSNLEENVKRLRYDLQTQKERSMQEIQTLSRLNEDMQLQLHDARNQADVYFRANSESQSQISSLNSEISLLKIAMASDTKEFQPTIINALQQELDKLRCEMTLMQSTGAVGNLDQSKMIAELRAKLKDAAEHVSQLLRERQQLIKECNRLRGSKQSGVVEPLISNRNSTAVETNIPKSATDVFTSKLQQLEELQKQLTKQQLIISSQKSKENEPPSKLTSTPTVSVDCPELSFGDSTNSAFANQSVVMSSMDSTINNLFNMVDKGPENFSPVTTRVNPTENLHVTGERTGKVKGKPEKRANVTKPISKPKITSQKAIRNYNVK